MKLPAHRTMLSAAAAASVLLMTAACGASDSEGASDTSTSSTPSATSDAPSSATAGGTYADGEYEGQGSYSNDGGVSEVGVEVTLADGVIEAVEVTPMAENLTSLQYQKKFAGGIADEVVGRSIDEIDVSKVSGSSLTSQGFNQAIEAIKAEAQA